MSQKSEPVYEELKGKPKEEIREWVRNYVREKEIPFNTLEKCIGIIYEVLNNPKYYESFFNPFLTIEDTAKETGLTYETAKRYRYVLRRLGIVSKDFYKIREKGFKPIQENLQNEIKRESIFTARSVAVKLNYKVSSVRNYLIELRKKGQLRSFKFKEKDWVSRLFREVFGRDTIYYAPDDPNIIDKKIRKKLHKKLDEKLDELFQVFFT
jgi:hypothetical protein